MGTRSLTCHVDWGSVIRCPVRIAVRAVGVGPASRVRLCYSSRAEWVPEVFLYRGVGAIDAVRMSVGDVR
jgi:hypothetical protein